MKLHAFVAMPCSKKPNAAGMIIDFDAVYAALIKPMIEAAGLTAFRADHEQRAGDIKTQMFQQLLIADYARCKPWNSGRNPYKPASKRSNGPWPG